MRSALVISPSSASVSRSSSAAPSPAPLSAAPSPMSSSPALPQSQSFLSSVGAAAVQSSHQTMESSLVDLLNTYTDLQMRKAQRKREEEQRKKRQAQQLQQQRQAQQAHTQAVALAADAIGMRGIQGLHAHARALSNAAATSPHNKDAPSPSHAQQQADAAAAAAPAETLPLGIFHSHFHLLTHLLPSLPISSLEHLLQFLQPTRIDYGYTITSSTGIYDAVTTSIMSSNSAQSTNNDNCMSYCFPQFDYSTQVELVELLIKAMLQLIYMREKQEKELSEEEEYWKKKVEGKKREGDDEKMRLSGHKQESKEGECPGEEKKQQPQQSSRRLASSSSSSSAVAVPSAPTPKSSSTSSAKLVLSASSICQLRLLHILRAYSGYYRLSYIIHRCVDYQNWIACAVAMENCIDTPRMNEINAVSSSSSSSTSSSSLVTRASIKSLLLASGSSPDINHLTISDALECRLKHMEQRLEKWEEWKMKRQQDESDQSLAPATAKTSVSLLLSDSVPLLPHDAWLSFDSYCIESGELYIQLVRTHLIKISTVSEQARLLALLMRGWKDWDLPQIILESVFLSHLEDIAEALCMLAFQKTSSGQTNGLHTRMPSGVSSGVAAAAEKGEHNFSTNSEPSSHSHNRSYSGVDVSANQRHTDSASAAPIFSAKLYLALTHYRLHQVARLNHTKSMAHSTSTAQLGAASSSSSTVAPPLGSQTPGPSSASQLHRLWSELLTNLNRDLDLPPNNPTNAILFRGTANPPGPLTTTSTQQQPLTRGSSLGSQMLTMNGKKDSTSKSFVVFTCGHSYPLKDFFSSSLPELLHQLMQLQPPIPVTAKFLQVEYQTLQDHKDDEDGEGSDDEEVKDANHAAASESDSKQSPSSLPSRRIVSLACPSCVHATILQMHSRHDKARQHAAMKANQQQQVHAWRMQQQQQQQQHHTGGLLGSSPASASATIPQPHSSSSSRSLTPTPYTLSTGSAPASTATTFSFMTNLRSTSSSSATDSSHSPSQLKPIGLPSGNAKQFGKVAQSDLA